MIYFFTLVLDGMPYITNHLPVFNRLSVPWKWIIIEGVSAPVKDTSWCKRIPPRLSEDGTHEYLLSIRSHPNVEVVSRPSWEGKTEMCNTALSMATRPGLLWQIDSDEVYNTHSIEKMHDAFMCEPSKNCARIYARYFLGQNIVITSNNTYGNRNGEWLRVWRYFPGMQFSSHEPPRLHPMTENGFTVGDTSLLGVSMDHYAYATEKQVAFKEKFYGYEGAVEQWRKIQANTSWPCRVGDFLKWVKDDAKCDRFYK